MSEWKPSTAGQAGQLADDYTRARKRTTEETHRRSYDKTLTERGEEKTWLRMGDDMAQGGRRHGSGWAWLRKERPLDERLPF